MRKQYSKKFMQEAFDRAYNGVIKQGRPSLVNGDLAFRGDNGCKCAVGHCVSDRTLKKAFKTGKVSNTGPAAQLAVVVGVRSDAKIYFWQDLAKCHDRPAWFNPEVFIKEFKACCRDFARHYGLSMKGKA